MKFFLKYFLKPLGGVLEFLLAFGAIYFVVFVLGALIPVSGDEPNEGIEIYVRTNDIHTDICLPSRSKFYNWTDFIPTDHFPNNRKHDFVCIGWGDKGFFIDTPTWDDLSVSTALKAALLPSPTAMHVEYLDRAPPTGERCKLKIVKLSKYRELIAFITSSFKKEGGKVKLIPDKGYWSNDNFYEAKGNYHLYKTCNRWTNEALKIAGIRTAIFALFSDGIMRHL